MIELDNSITKKKAIYFLELIYGSNLNKVTSRLKDGIYI